jgi:uncharacterized protein (TIGR00297 family)
VLAPLYKIAVAGFLSLLVAASAYRLRALTASGAGSAFVVGTIVLAAGGWREAIALLAFFISSSALSRWRKARKDDLGPAKAGARDASQVWANGGVAVLCLLAPLVSPEHFSSARWHLAFLGALAAANADTWATEVGAAAGGQPWDLRTRRRVQPGVSGAVTPAGTLAAASGATLIGLFADGRHFAAVAAGGFLGALADSIAGATIQAQWRSPRDGSDYTETPQANSKPARGFAPIDNNVVNLIGTAAGALATELLIYGRF